MEEADKKVEESEENSTKIFGLRTVSNREEQVIDFVTANVAKNNKETETMKVYSMVHPHGMKGYVFVEAASKDDVERAAFKIPYSKGVLPNELKIDDISHIVDINRKIEVTIKQKDIVEIIAAPFLRSQARITRVDLDKGEVIVELLDAAVPIPMTRSIEDVRVIRRDEE